MSDTLSRTAEEQALIDAAAPAGDLETPAVINEPAANLETPPAPPAPEQKRYEYQPSDEQGRPIGGRQVILYTSSEELAEKLSDQNTLLIRKLREETRKNRLGIQDKEEISQEAQRFEAPLEFSPRVLTQEERYRIAREINDPDTFDQATDSLLEARFGAKPEVLAKTISELQIESMRNRAVAESEAFMAANTDYVRCDENGKAITSWLLRYDLAPVKANYQKAYDTLKSAGVLVVNEPAPTPAIAPIPEPVAPIPEPVVPPPAAAAPLAPAHIPTGLTRGSATDVTPTRNVGDDIVFDIPQPGGSKKRVTGMAALNAMPADEYKHRLLHEPGFREKADKLEEETAKRKFVRR